MLIVLKERIEIDEDQWHASQLQVDITLWWSTYHCSMLVYLFNMLVIYATKSGLEKAHRLLIGGYHLECSSNWPTWLSWIRQSCSHASALFCEQSKDVNLIITFLKYICINQPIFLPTSMGTQHKCLYIKLNRDVALHMYMKWCNQFTNNTVVIIAVEYLKSNLNTAGNL